MRRIGQNSIALVTPMKDEIKNVPFLVDSLESQSIPISYWIVVDNGSIDGSAELLKKSAVRIVNIKKIIILKYEEKSEKYALGLKYSRIVNFGIQSLLDMRKACRINIDYIGILDSDCFPEHQYYQRLVEKFRILPRLGIASGIIYTSINGIRNAEITPKRWARGGIRLWRAACFDECGYIVGKSADALSSAKAWVRGWHSQSFKDCLVRSRELGEREDFSYYGSSAYYRFVPWYMALLKSLKYLIERRPDRSIKYIAGYLRAMKARDRGAIDRDIRLYYKLLPLRILIETYIVFRNERLLQKDKV